jgi:hypothetical protein
VIVTGLIINGSDRLIISDSERFIISNSFSDRLSLHLYFREEGRGKKGSWSLLPVGARESREL